MIKVQSPAAKKILAEELVEHNPVMLDAIQDITKVFGKSEWVGYEGKHEEQIRERLEKWKSEETLQIR